MREHAQQGRLSRIFDGPSSQHQGTSTPLPSVFDALKVRAKCSVRSQEGFARPSRSNRKKEDHNADPECPRGTLTGLRWRSLAMLATARMVERYTGISESALASPTEHFTS